MSETNAPDSPSDNFWPNSSKFVTSSLPIHAKKKHRVVCDLLSAVDEAPEFYDPYSDLNLFLSQKVKHQMQHCHSSKKWSIKLQEELLGKIAPDFQEKFPQFRLGVSALKKTWEKVVYYSEQIHNQKEAINQDGKINIDFFIKENLKNYIQLKTSNHLHPSYYAHQLAMKISECIATMDGVRPPLDHLTKMIWAIQRHLLKGTDEPCNSPYDDYDEMDQLIVKTLLEFTAKNPQMSQQELEGKIQDTLHDLLDLPSFSSHDQMIGSISALLAEKIDDTGILHRQFFTEQKKAMIHFIKRHSSLCKTSVPLPQLSEFVRRIIALYSLASNLPKTLTEEQIHEAVYAVYPHANASKPMLPQALYAFISAELVLMKSEEYCSSPSYVASCIWVVYREAISLPQLQGKQRDFLEIAIWKTLSQTEGLLEKLPYRIGKRIEEEVANLLIENPTQSFSGLVHETANFFKKAKELVQLKDRSETKKKIHNWSLQSDMLCRWIRIHKDSTLLRLITEKWKEHPHVLPHHLFVSEICQDYLKSYPELAPYSAQLSLRVWILYKYSWYALFGETSESSFDRFLKWHSYSLLFSNAALDRDHIVEHLEDIIGKALPLAPFTKKQAEDALETIFSKR